MIIEQDIDWYYCIICTLGSLVGVFGSIYLYKYSINKRKNDKT